MAGAGPLWRWLALAPLLIFLGVFVGGTLLFGMALSLGFAPWLGVDNFPSLAIYREVLGQSGFWPGVMLTLYYALISTLLASTLGVLLVINLGPRGRGWLARLYGLPIVLPYTVGLALAVLIMGKGGFLSRLAWHLGLIDGIADFPRLLQTHAGWGIIAVYLWKQLPFVALSTAALYARFPEDQAQAARLLGASRAQVLRHIVIPYLWPALASAALIVFAFNMVAIEVPLVLGAGFPETLPVIAYQAFTAADPREQLRGMALAMILFFLTLGVVLVALRLGRGWQQ